MKPTEGLTPHYLLFLCTTAGASSKLAPLLHIQFYVALIWQGLTFILQRVRIHRIKLVSTPMHGETAALPTVLLSLLMPH